MTAWGFSTDPFANYVAEDEKERLDRSFVAPNYFEDIVGEADDPKPTFVFGSRGEGKSTLCHMVAQRLRSADRPPLIVHANDFSGWSADKIVEGLTLQDHMLRILVASAVALVETLEDNHEPLSALSKRDRALLVDIVARLLPLVDEGAHEHRLAILIDRANGAGHIRRYTGFAVRWLSRFLRRKRFEFEGNELKDEHGSRLLTLLTVITQASPGTRGAATPQAVFDAFLKLVRRLGFSSMYVLVDRIDEVDAVIDRPDLVARLVAPLVRSVSFLGTDRLGIKLFLPLEARAYLTGLRLDRIGWHEIEWDEHRLRSFLRKRIQAYSDGKCDTLEHVIEGYPDFERRVFRASAGTPRNLLRILDLIVSTHCDREDDSRVISRRDAEAGLKTFTEYRTQEGDREIYEQRLVAWDLEHGSKDES